MVSQVGSSGGVRGAMPNRVVDNGFRSSPGSPATHTLAPLPKSAPELQELALSLGKGPSIGKQTDCALGIWCAFDVLRPFQDAS